MARWLFIVILAGMVAAVGGIGVMAADMWLTPPHPGTLAADNPLLAWFLRIWVALGLAAMIAIAIGFARSYIVEVEP